MQYKAGSVLVENGSAIVKGVNTSWLTNVSPGNIFALQDDVLFYDILTVDSDTQLTLTLNYVLPNSIATGYQDINYSTLIVSNNHGLIPTSTYTFDLNVDGGGANTISVTPADFTGSTINDLLNYIETLIVGATITTAGNSIRIFSESSGATSSIAISSDSLFSALANYTGLGTPNTLISGATYSITRDFTPRYEFPYPVRGDIGTAAIIARALLDIDSELKRLEQAIVPQTYPINTALQHDPDEILEYGFDWVNILLTGETISTSNWVASDPVNVTLGTESINGTQTTVFITSVNVSLVGTDISLENTITTSGGRTYVRSMSISIIQK